MRPTSKSMVQFRAFCDDDDDPPPTSRPAISVSIPHFQKGDIRKAGQGEVVDHVPAVTVTNPDEDDDSDASEVLLKPFQSVGSMRQHKSVVILQKRSMSSMKPKFTVQSAGSETGSSLSGPRGVQAAVLAYTQTGGMSTMRPSSAKPSRPRVPIKPDVGSSSFNSTPRSTTRPGSSLQQRGGVPYSPRRPN